MNREKILELLSNAIDVDVNQLMTLPEDTLLSDIGMNSFRFIQFIVALETEFHFEVLDSDLMLSNFQTIDILFKTLRKYFQGDSPVKKVLICDCDNCIWHGVSGEEEICLDNATITFQMELVRLYEKGVLLCLCSKNESENITNAFRELAMPLKPEHILISKVNRNNKAENIQAIADELNLSADSFVFVDDSDYELGLINALLTEVTTIKADYSSDDFISRITACFPTASHDSDRTRQYREQKEREKEKLKITDILAYNESLQTTITCGIASLEQADRIAELSQRTNQCNLSCARFTREEIQRLIDDSSYTLFSLSASDKYGDMGIVGAAVICHDPFPVIEAFFLSCRAFDRDLEVVLLNKIKEQFPSDLMGIYRESDKNRRFKNFYTNHGVPLYERL